MTDTNRVRDDQHQMWNGPGAEAWIDNRDILDAMFRPFEAILLSRRWCRRSRAACSTSAAAPAAPASPSRGDLGAEGSVLGLDISAPMIAVAEARAAAAGSTARFIAADAATHDFAAADFDMIVSRFGVMFFADPVAAFAQPPARRAAGRRDVPSSRGEARRTTRS